jgi:hypothetical protein
MLSDEKSSGPAATSVLPVTDRNAQFILVPIAGLTPKPARLSMDQAGSAPHAQMQR